MRPKLRLTWAAAGIFWLVIAVLGVRWALTVYSGRPADTPMDPRELALAHTVLARVLAGDSTGAVAAGAEPRAVGWALAATQLDPTLVRGWAAAPESRIGRTSGDTVRRTWYTAADMSRCGGAAALSAVFFRESRRSRLIEWRSPCVPLAPITFEGAGAR